MTRRRLPGDLQLVEIPAGRFTMGSLEGETEHGRFEVPAHEVVIGGPFALSETPITQEQFEAVMGYDPSHFAGRRRHPVESVSWHEAAAFCNALATVEGLVPFFALAGEERQVWVTGILPEGGEGGGFRLPTEAEWEYACRAGTTTRYWWGDGADGLDTHAWWRNNSGEQTQPVGHEGRRNLWGLADMIGNVWEWCLDPWTEDYRDAPAEVNPRSPAVSVAEAGFAGRSRPWRGGSWFCANSGDLRCAFRVNGLPEQRGISLGFRVLRY